MKSSQVQKKQFGICYNKPLTENKNKFVLLELEEVIKEKYPGVYRPGHGKSEYS